MPSRVEDVYQAPLFHYTNPRGSDGILRDREIRVTKAGSRFAWFGEGVYMTALSPSFGRNHLLYNNHHKTHTHDRNLWAKTSIYFKVHSRYLPGVRKVVDRYDRDIYVCPNSIDLNYVPYETGLSDKYQARVTFVKPLPARQTKRTVASYYSAPSPRQELPLPVTHHDYYDLRPIGLGLSAGGILKNPSCPQTTLTNVSVPSQKPLNEPLPVNKPFGNAFPASQPPSKPLPVVGTSCDTVLEIETVPEVKKKKKGCASCNIL